MIKQTLGRLLFILAILLGLGLFILTTRVTAEELPWPGATDPAPLTQGNDLRERSAIAVAPGIDGNVSVAWASERSGGITLTQQVAGSWATSKTVALDVTGKAGWHPNIVYSGTDVLATWVQGEAPSPVTYLRAVRQETLGQDLNTLSTQTIITPVYGAVSPDVIIAPSGIHMVFSASRNNNPAIEVWNWNLYYMHRPLTTTTWSTPTVVITSTEVLSPGVSGQIWYPKLALDQNGTDIHIVWEQKGEGFTVWYIHGIWTTQGVQWDTPMRASPTDQNAIRPNIAMDQNQQVHISWSEVIRGSGGFSNPDAQYINYQRGTPDQGNLPYRLQNRSLKVNNNFPTIAQSSISVQGERLCVAWHGFYEGNNKEEIWMRCSPDGGLSWQGEINISQSQDWLSIFPRVRLDSQNQAHLVWMEYFLESNERQPEGLYYRTGVAELAQVFLPVITREQ